MLAAGKPASRRYCGDEPCLVRFFAYLSSWNNPCQLVEGIIVLWETDMRIESRAVQFRDWPQENSFVEYYLWSLSSLFQACWHSQSIWFGRVQQVVGKHTTVLSLAIFCLQIPRQIESYVCMATIAFEKVIC